MAGSSSSALAERSAGGTSGSTEHRPGKHRAEWKRPHKRLSTTTGARYTVPGLSGVTVLRRRDDSAIVPATISATTPATAPAQPTQDPPERETIAPVVPFERPSTAPRRAAPPGRTAPLGPSPTPTRATADLQAIRAAGLVRPASEHAADTLGSQQVLPVPAELRPLLPAGGLRRGTTVAVRSTSALLALLAAASQAGSWCAVVGMPQLNPVAAAEAGIVLERLAFVPYPGTHWTAAVAALLDGFDLVVAAPPGPIAASVASRLAARARQRGSVLLPAGPLSATWTGADLIVEAVRGDVDRPRRRPGTAAGPPVDATSVGAGVGLRAPPDHRVAPVRGGPAAPDTGKQPRKPSGQENHSSAPGRVIQRAYPRRLVSGLAGDRGRDRRRLPGRRAGRRPARQPRARLLPGGPRRGHPPGTAQAGGAGSLPGASSSSSTTRAATRARSSRSSPRSKSSRPGSRRSARGSARWPRAGRPATSAARRARPSASSSTSPSAARSRPRSASPRACSPPASPPAPAGSSRPGGPPAFLAGLGVAALGRPTLVDLLRRLGIHTLGEFAALPAGDVLARFGFDAALAHRLAAGEAARPLAPRQPPPDLDVLERFDEPIERVDAAAFAARGARRAAAREARRARAGLHPADIEALTANGEELHRTWRHDGLLTVGGDRRPAPLAARRMADPDRSGAKGPPRASPGCGLVPEGVVVHVGLQPGLWGEAGDERDRAHRALSQVQGLLGPEAVLTAVLGGGRVGRRPGAAGAVGRRAGAGPPGRAALARAVARTRRRRPCWSSRRPALVSARRRHAGRGHRDGS